MPSVRIKEAYSVLLGVTLALVGVALWQRFVPDAARDPVEPPAVMIPPLPSPLPQPTYPPTATQGSLRVGNRTDHSVRVVVLSRKLKIEPLNWDFAPQEGGREGLLLSLPNNKVRVDRGDVIVAFATDGSRAYWGPNIVGETEAPFWDGDRREWSMVLQP
ncbi:MAG: hypothetical protein HC919_07995 [Oscillatoriales cyanobacterium SM2_2_1]|nr:hypothetical protein [Oscillatoriales cyanobacterium SM2_2_1]